MRKLVALVAGLAVLGFVNFGIWQREQLVTGGRVMLLRLSPVDPRSLMQGDYMRLNFEVADRAFPWRSRPRRGDGHVVVGLDGRRVGHFRRIDQGGAPGGNLRAGAIWRVPGGGGWRDDPHRAARRRAAAARGRPLTPAARGRHMTFATLPRRPAYAMTAENREGRGK